MPVIQTSDGPCFYRLDGPAEAPVLVLSHSLGMDHTMWDEQATALAPHLRLLRYDTRGHGATASTAGDYSLAVLGADVLRLVDALGVGRFAFCGISLGGMVGQWLAINHPDRLTHLILANTSPRLTDPAGMEARRRLVLDRGMAGVVDTVLARFFSAGVLAGVSPTVAGARRTLLATDPTGYAGCCAAIRDLDHRHRLAEITTPTLVISGDGDVSMPWADHARVLAEHIPGARTVRLTAAHLSNLEQPRSFTAALAEFVIPTPTDTLTTGVEVRRRVLGDEHVDRAIANTTEFTRDFQDLITRYAWGTIWSRPGLDQRTRRLLVLSLMAALGRWEEFRMHLRTGLAHELEWTDVEEVLLQAAIYAGVPVANTGFHAAAEEWERHQQSGARSTPA